MQITDCSDVLKQYALNLVDFPIELENFKFFSKPELHCILEDILIKPRSTWINSVAQNWLKRIVWTEYSVMHALIEKLLKISFFS